MARSREELFAALLACEPVENEALDRWLDYTNERNEFAFSFYELENSIGYCQEQIKSLRTTIITDISEPKPLSDDAFVATVTAAVELLSRLRDNDRRAVLTALELQRLERRREELTEQYKKFQESRKGEE